MEKQKKRRRMRCINCGSFAVNRNGTRTNVTISTDRHSIRKVQKYWCRSCGRFFTKRKEPRKRYSSSLKLEATRMHVEERQSFRVIAKRMKERYGIRTNARRMCQMVNEVAKATKSSIEIQREYKPRWEGYLVVDDKVMNIRGRKKISLIARDRRGDPLHSELLEDATQEEYDNFFRYIVEQLKYPVKAVTTDIDPRLEKAIKSVISPDIPHQKCIWHALENIKVMIGYQKTARQYLSSRRLYEQTKDAMHYQSVPYDSMVARLQHAQRMAESFEKEYNGKKDVVETAREIIEELDEKNALKLFQRFRQKYKTKYPDVLSFMERHYIGLRIYHTDKYIERTNVTMENFNKQLKRRFVTIESFQSSQTAFNYLNLIRNYLRFKPYTDCRGKRRWKNGLCPLEVCRVKLSSKDWLKNSINLPKLSVVK